MTNDRKKFAEIVEFETVVEQMEGTGKTNYRDVAIEVKLECLQHHEFHITLQDIRIGKWCPQCINKTTNYLSKELEGNIIEIVEYSYKEGLEIQIPKGSKLVGPISNWIPKGRPLDKVLVFKMNSHEMGQLYMHSYRNSFYEPILYEDDEGNIISTWDFIFYILALKFNLVRINFFRAKEHKRVKPVYWNYICDNSNYNGGYFTCTQTEVIPESMKLILEKARSKDTIDMFEFSVKLDPHNKDLVVGWDFSDNKSVDKEIVTKEEPLDKTTTILEEMKLEDNTITSLSNETSKSIFSPLNLDNYGIIYLVALTRAEDGTQFDKVIYKVGRSKGSKKTKSCKRPYTDYGTNVRVIITRDVHDDLLKSLESYIIAVFRKKFIRYHNNEYFDGNPRLMVQEINKMCDLHAFDDKINLYPTPE